MRNTQKKIALTDDEWKALKLIAPKSQDAIRILLKMAEDNGITEGLKFLWEPATLKDAILVMKEQQRGLDQLRKLLTRP